MSSKTIVLTGSTSGIGKTLALDLASQGHHLILPVRNPEKGEILLKEIKSQNSQAQPELVRADFGIMQDVRNVVDQIKDRKIDVLINNAWFLGNPNHTINPEGMELTVTTNFLSMVILCHGLLEALKRSSNAQIINVGSAMYKYGNYDLGKINDPSNYKPLLKYGDSKKMVTLYSSVFSEKTGITCNCVDPGTVRTNIAHSYGKFFRFLYEIGRPFMRSTTKGADTISYLVNDKPSVSGKLWRDRKIILDIGESYEPKEFESLWNWSREVTLRS